MVPAIVVCMALLATARAAPSSCQSDMDCSLNGHCVNQACECAPPWQDSATQNCNLLQVAPHPNDYAPAYGGHDSNTLWGKFNVTSWGGNAILGDDGAYHMFVSEMADGAGLGQWGKVSQITHAIAKSPLDRFQKHDVPLPKWAHNASPVRMKNGTWLLFHIGSSNSTSSFLHYSNSPFGPWEPLPALGCNNPAPFIHPNGSVYCGCNRDGITIYRSEQGTGLPKSWAFAGHIKFPGDNQYLRTEDPFVWVDRNSNWHALAHRYDYRDGYPVNPNQTEPVLVSAHAYSQDGSNWVVNAEQPYNPWITFENGTRQNYSTWERPHLIFDENQTPIYLVNGVSPYWGSPPCHACDARPGSEHSCVVCKTSKDVDYTYTLVTKLGAQ